MVEMQRKLEQGIKVDPGILNVLSGIMNILCQSEALEVAEKRIEILEQENITNKVKVDNLESWVQT